MLSLIPELVKKYLATRDPWDLKKAFIFSESPQGHRYWAAFAYDDEELTDEAREYLESLLPKEEA